tara:strand:- start:3219 stop:4151 length:933 start_codon:yes stop_codon:yes gene_type:complete
MATTKVIADIIDLNKANTTKSFKMPSGTAFSGTPVEGMLRNDTSQSSQSSASTMQFYNGTAWKNFANVGSCTTSTLNYPTGVTGTALYEFDGNANSTSSSSYDAASTANLTFNTSIKRYGTSSAYFNGSNTTINLPATSFHFSTFTISCWVYLPTYPPSSVYVIMNTYDYGSGPSKGWQLYITGDGKLQVDLHSGDCGSPYPIDPSCTVYTRLTSTNLIPQNTWSHLSLVCGGTGNPVTLYIDGTQEATTTMQGLAYHAGATPNIGYRIYSVSGTIYQEAYFGGYIDQLRGYNTALTGTQIQSLQNEVPC